MRSIKAVGFDLDGTLLNTRVDYRSLNDADREVLLRHGIPFEEVFGTEYPPRRKRAPIREWLESKGRGEEFPGLDREIDDLCTFYETQYMDGAEGFPGTLECIESLKSMGLKVGLLTRGSREYAQRVLPRFGLYDVMDAVVGRDHTWFDDAKPSPVAIMHLAGELGVEPEEILYVGDSMTDYLPCRDSGAMFIGVLTGSMDRGEWAAAGVERVIDRVGSLTDVIGEYVMSDDRIRGLLLYNGYSHIPAYEHQISRLSLEFASRGVVLDVRGNGDFASRIEDGGIRCEGVYDFCLFLDKDEYTSTMIGKTGIPMFNSPESIRICDDKMLTYIALSGSGIAMPDTSPGPLFYDPSMGVSEESLDVVEGRYGYPLIIKESFGSQGRNVFLIADRGQLRDRMTALRGRRYLIQEFIPTSEGEDLRVIVIGGRVVGGILRRSDGDFRSNIGSGGMSFEVDVSEESRDVALRVASLLGLDYCGLDLLRDEDGRYTILCEVNSNAFFESFEEATGVNVAGMYAEHILDSIGKKEGPRNTSSRGCF